MNGKRLIAYVIDLVITISVTAMYLFFATNFYYDSATYTQGNFMVLCAMISIFFLLGYVPTKTNGQTLGKIIMKLRVENLNGKPRTMWQNILRELILKYGFIYMLVIFDAVYMVYQSLVNKKIEIVFGHDILLKTKVVSTKEVA